MVNVRGSTRIGIATCVLLALCACSSSDKTPGKGGGDDDDGGKDSADGAARVEDGSADGSSGSGIDTLDNGLPACGRDELSATPRTANVLLVIDESGSMTDKPKGFDTDKWSALKDALGSALGAVGDDVSFGLELYPHAQGSTPIALACTDDCCEMPDAPGIQVEVAPGSASVDAITKALKGSSPGGGTPTALALSRALAYYTTGAGKSLKGDHYVLLATDGGPNCNTKLSCDKDACTTNVDGDCSIPDGNCCDPMFGGDAAKARCLDDDATLAEIKKLADAHIQTFVVGIPGSETYASSLDAFAVAGGKPNPAGTPKYYAVDAAGGAAGLEKTLSLITKNVITSCLLQLGSKPPNPAELNVYIDGKLLKQAGPDGWKLDQSSDPPTVVLQGEACATVQTRGAKSVRVLYGCPTVE